jgi:hypothetical protein
MTIPKKKRKSHSPNATKLKWLQKRAKELASEAEMLRKQSQELQFETERLAREVERIHRGPFSN